MKIKNLIFDLDGTLIDSSDGVVEAVNYSLRMMNQPEQSPEKIKPYIGYSLKIMYPVFTDAPLDELYRHFQTKASWSIVSSTVVLDGVENTVRRLVGKGYRLAIASTKIRYHIDRIVEKFAWQNLFAAWAGGDEVTEVKPDPEILHLVLERLGADPAETIVIGDTINDIEAARAVPMLSVAVASPYGEHQSVKNSQPDYYLESIEQLPALIEKINNGALK
ncbi:MAG: HAD family hydrolase [Candidatus Zixiibacteriota bacterium]